MKKTEMKSKTSKAPKAKGGSVAKPAVKVASKVTPPVKSLKAELKPIDKKGAISAISGKPLDKGDLKRPRPRRRPSRSKNALQSGPKPIPVHKNGPALKPSIAKSAIAKAEQELAEKKEKKSKDKSAPKPKAPMKLVQVVPKSKPSFIQTAPVKREKMLMRYGKPTKRILYTVDFLLKASPTILYHFMTTPSCLVRWFCDAVDITNEYYTFSWNGNTELAELIDDIEDERLRFRWLDGEDDDEFFEFRISTADITDETILEIVDFAWADEVEEQKELWRTQVENLRKETGDA